jgi:hypothetical protein
MSILTRTRSARVAWIVDRAKRRGEAGDVTGARVLLEDVLPLAARTFGGSDPNTLSVRQSLAHWTRKAGDLQRARDQFATLLPVREQVSGPDDVPASSMFAPSVHLNEVPRPSVWCGSNLLRSWCTTLNLEQVARI